MNVDNQSRQLSAQDTQFLLEYSRAANEELRFHLHQRDTWIKIQLLAQAGLLALAQGVKFGGMEASSPVLLALWLAVPISLILSLLYVIEDRVIAHLMKYLEWLSDESPSPKTKNFEKFYRPLARDSGTDCLKLYAKLMAFLVIPGLLTGFGACVHSQADIRTVIVGASLSTLAGIAVAALLIWAYYKRKNDSESPPEGDK